MLKVENVTLRFGGLVANDNVSFDIEEDTILGLIGPNGAGKTTLFNVISGVYKPTSGKVLLQGTNISGLPPYKINDLGIARTYQNINLFKKMTVLDNVKAGRHCRTKSGLISSIFKTKSEKNEERETTEKCMEILTFMGLDHLAHTKAGSLPYGPQRRLEISRAMATEPKLLLLDEPAAGMNTAEKEELSQTIKKIRDIGMTILLVEHDMKLVMSITEKICVLNYGKKIALGDPKSISKNEEVIAAYLGGSVDERKNS